MCGSTAGQNQVGGQQMTAYQTMQQEANSVFGENSALYKDMIAAFEPILNAGPNQEGFSPGENAALNTEASQGVASNYQNAEKGVRESGAAAGGGNDYIPSGQESEEEAQVGEAAAGQESAEQNQITEANYATGRQNWEAAESGLVNAGSVFAPSESLYGDSTSAGSAASTTQNQIAQENQSWMGAVGGMVGQLGSSYLGAASWV